MAKRIVLLLGGAGIDACAFVTAVKTGGDKTGLSSCEATGVVFGTFTATAIVGGADFFSSGFTSGFAGEMIFVGAGNELKELNQWCF